MLSHEQFVHLCRAKDHLRRVSFMVREFPFIAPWVSAVESCIDAVLKGEK